MRGRKSERTLKLEQESLAEILKPQNILSRSQTAIKKAVTLKDAIPELTRISIQENLNLTIGKEFKAAVTEMKRRNGNR